MRIIIIVVYYLPSPKSCASLVHDLAYELLNQGHEVTVVTTDDNLNCSNKYSKENGLGVLRIKTNRIDGANKYFRFINEFLLSWLIWYRGRKYFNTISCDLVIWYSPSIFFGELIKKLRKKFNCNSYLILRDLFPQWALDTGILKRGIIYKILHYYEKLQYEQADVIGVQSPNNLQYFDSISLTNKLKLEVLYNWINTYKLPKASNYYRKKYNLLGKVVFFYGGNIGVAQDVENLVRLAKRLSSIPQSHILLVGDGSEVDSLKNLIQDFDLFNISVFGSVSQEEYHSMLAEFDIGLISLDRNFKTSNFPGKMLGYMKCNMPILASVNFGNDLINLIEDNEIGLASLNGDDDLLFNNALRLVYSPELRVFYGTNGNILLKKLFSVQSATTTILSHF